MIFEKLPLREAWLIKPTPFLDQRGSFARSFCRTEFSEHGLQTEFEQANVSRNPLKGTLRGMHYQRAPHAEVKIIHCLRGAIADAIVDVAEGSETFGHSITLELSAENGYQLYVPKGYAHGFLTLQPDTVVCYQVSTSYAPDAEAGLRWNDSQFDIDWPAQPEHLSDKDNGWPDWTLDADVSLDKLRIEER